MPVAWMEETDCVAAQFGIASTEGAQRVRESPWSTLTATI